MKPVHAQLPAQSGLNRTVIRALTGPDGTLVSGSRNYRSCGVGYTGSNIAMSVHHEGCLGTTKAGSPWSSALMSPDAQVFRALGGMRERGQPVLGRPASGPLAKSAVG